MVSLLHDQLVEYRRKHPAWRLLRADNAPLILGFLSTTFLQPNVRRMPGPDLVEALEAYLSDLRRSQPDTYPRTAETYLAEWSDPRVGFLRRTVPAGSEHPYYEPTAAVELAAGFCRDLGPRRFVGTASRLLTIRDLLRQIAVGSETDPGARIAALERQRAEIDDQLAAIRAGVDTRLEPAAVRERYQQVVLTARTLLGDLRAVEDNFRELDRSVRAKATTWDGPRGTFLSEVFGSQQEIGATDQGRSWTAFWEYLLSASAQDELAELLDVVESLPSLQGWTGEAEQVLRNDLFTAAELTQRTIASLSSQLRRFLDDAAWAETRRINKLLRSALAAASHARDRSDGPLLGAEIDGLRADIALPLERPPYTPRTTTEIDVDEDATVNDAELDVSELLELSYVDLSALREAVARTLAAHSGVASLGQVVAEHPLTEGLAELVGYLQVGTEDDARITDAREQISWDTDGRNRVAEMPMLLFTDTAGRPTSWKGADERH
ncbi:DUF3375 domain-containing protein [Saccharothrix sp. HUAS TT1]|uniref:DUF3375 domain-containing protein n=1 Tax=unclassified Saccharothrix TaxID=2593673 RepID=UPI00345B5920